MKVQARCNPSYQHEVFEESTNYYIVKYYGHQHEAVPKTDYEPVQEWHGVFSGPKVYCDYRVVIKDGRVHLEGRYA